MFRLLYSHQAQKFLRQTDRVLADRIVKKVEQLKATPILHDTKSIVGYKEKLFRVRVGDYRILYEIDFKEKMIGVVKIDKRSKAYR